MGCEIAWRRKGKRIIEEGRRRRQSGKVEGGRGKRRWWKRGRVWRKGRSGKVSSELRRRGCYSWQVSKSKPHTLTGSGNSLLTAAAG